MRYKLIAYFIMVLMIIALCTGSSTAKTLKEIPSDTQIIEEMTKGKIKSTVTQEDEKMVELKHWKYGQKSNKSNNAAVKKTTGNTVTQGKTSVYAADYRPLSIYFPSEDEIKILTEGLIKLGYLKKPTSNQQEFINALDAFRSDYNIKSNCDIKLEDFAKLQSKKK